MWRKIHSNRDPRDTLYSEIRKEFRPGVEKLITCCREMLSGNPKTAFSLMSSLLLVSAVLSFTVFGHPDKDKKKASVQEPAVITEGFSQLIQATGKLKETIRLKQTVDSLTKKKQLDAADSLLLDNVLSRLQQIQKLK